MAEPKRAHALTTYYSGRYQEKYGSKPVVNRNSARWLWSNILIDITDTEARALIDYYFETVSTNGHSLEWFFYNYDRLMSAKETKDIDSARLAKIRAESKRRAEEWRKKIGDN